MCCSALSRWTGIEVLDSSDVNFNALCRLSAFPCDTPHAACEADDTMTVPTFRETYSAEALFSLAKPGE